MSKGIRDAIMTAFVATIIGLVANITIAHFNEENGVVRIGNTVKYSETVFITPIEIICYKDKTIEDFVLEVPEVIDSQDIISNAAFNLEKVNNNAGNPNLSIMRIERVLSGQQISLLVKTSGLIASEDIKIYQKGKGIAVERPLMQNSPITRSLITLLLSAIIYGTAMGIFAYIGYKTREKHIELISISTKNLNDQLEVLTKNSNDAEKKIETVIEENKADMIKVRKKEIILQSRINEYKKELEFWRDTLRKFIYQSSGGKVSAEDTINLISKELKTYQTKCGNGLCYESIETMAKIYVESEVK